MRSIDRLLESPLVYRAWQAPFAEQKLRPVLRCDDVARARRILDVGCGPGTNARHFAGRDYVGVDLNERYLAHARRVHEGRFVAADVTKWRSDEGDFDLILANSFFHHVDDESTHEILAHLETLLAPDGAIHVLDLVLPEESTISRRMALADRGDHPRPLETWREMFSRHFATERFERYALGLPGLELWRMVHFHGRRRNG